MDDPRVLKMIAIGLVLAALAVGYFLLTGGFTVGKPKQVQTQVNEAVPTPIPTPSPIPSVLGQETQILPTPTPTSAYERIVDRTKGGVQTLPNTGFPVELAVIFSASAIISGWSLRKFPH